MSAVASAIAKGTLSIRASVEQVVADADRDRWFTADQAVDYGLVDQVITSAREAADEGRPARTKD